MTPRPVMAGIHSAVVIGDSGEEIHSEEYARVKVSFFWDHRKDVTADNGVWVRLIQPWAGNTWGWQSLPRVGCEVAVAFFDDREARLRTLKIMNDIEHNLTGYLSMVAIINFAVGVAAGVIAWSVGLPDPIAWAVLAFILNFLPYIGALMMEAALFLVGLVTFPTLTHALAAPLLFVVFATLEGHFITPSLIGRRLTQNLSIPRPAAAEAARTRPISSLIPSSGSPQNE